MRILTAPKYRHFIPQSSVLTFKIPSTSVDGSNKLSYQFIIDQEYDLKAKELPSALWDPPEQSFIVYVNGIQQKNPMRVFDKYNDSGAYPMIPAYGKSGAHFYPYLVYLYTYDHIFHGPLDVNRPYQLGDVVKLVSTETFDGWYHLDIRHLLIQGANPSDNEVLGNQEMFQGGYRLRYDIIEGPVYGEVRVCDTHLGWDYKPPAGYRGVDSFSYILKTEFGQKSEPKCCSIYVGL